MMNTDIPLILEDLSVDPFLQFEVWYHIHHQFKSPEPTVVALATADKSGRPSCRMVLLKSYDKNGFVFYTNFESRKGRELESNPFASLAFYFGEMARQIRVCGRVVQVSDAESDEYFSSRPFESRLSAIASKQSSEIQTREDLERKIIELREKYAGKEVPRPKNWGGFRIVPDEIEFWQGRLNRLHDRFLYKRENSAWSIKRLSP